MKAHDIFQSDFLKAADLSDGGDDYKSMVVTITGVETSKPFDDGNTQRMLSFRETEKKLGLNRTNWNKCASLTKKDDDEDWIGHKIELWVDPDVNFGGKTVPAIRIRKVAFKDAIAPEHKTLPPDEPAAVAKVTTKGEAWTAWKGFGGSADKFKAEAESVAAKTGKAIADFGADEWNKILDGYVPF